MFRNRKKHTNKIFLKKAVIYKYRKDTGQLDIYPNCMLFQKDDKTEYYARGVTKIIGPENLTIIGGKPGEVFESGNDILFWLPEQDDIKAKEIVCQHIINSVDSMIEKCLDELIDARNLSTTMMLCRSDIDINNEIMSAINDRLRLCNTSSIKLKMFLVDRNKHVRN